MKIKSKYSYMYRNNALNLAKSRANETNDRGDKIMCNFPSSEFLRKKEHNYSGGSNMTDYMKGLNPNQHYKHFKTPMSDLQQRIYEIAKKRGLLERLNINKFARNAPISNAPISDLQQNAYKIRKQKRLSIDKYIKDFNRTRQGGRSLVGGRTWLALNGVTYTEFPDILISSYQGDLQYRRKPQDFSPLTVINVKDSDLIVSKSRNRYKSDEEYINDLNDYNRILSKHNLPLLQKDKSVELYEAPRPKSQPTPYINRQDGEYELATNKRGIKAWMPRSGQSYRGEPMPTPQEWANSSHTSWWIEDGNPTDINGFSPTNEKFYSAGL